MTATYTDPSNSNSDAVRFLIGDTDVADAALTDSEIAFALTQAENDIYLAAAMCARAIGAKYASDTDQRFENVWSNGSSTADNYYKLAVRLESQSKKFGSKGFGVPLAGGITVSGIRANDENDDRVQPKFKQDQFANPPSHYDGDKYGY
jgi:hypothetical protein